MSERCSSPSKHTSVAESQKVWTLYKRQKLNNTNLNIFTEHYYRKHEPQTNMTAFHLLPCFPKLQRHLFRACFSLLSVGRSGWGHLSLPPKDSARENRGGH